MKATLAVAGLASLMIVGSTASAAPAGGPIKVFISNLATKTNKITIIGAIGDYGTAIAINKSGKANPDGNYEKITLQQGGFWVNATGFNNQSIKAKPVANPATCSVLYAPSGPGTIFNGTGLYTGISGTVKISDTFAAIAPRYTSGAKKGQCNFSSKAKPLGVYNTITAAGNVKFG